MTGRKVTCQLQCAVKKKYFVLHNFFSLRNVGMRSPSVSRSNGSKTPRSVASEPHTSGKNKFQRRELKSLVLFILILFSLDFT